MSIIVFAFGGCVPFQQGQNFKDPIRASLLKSVTVSEAGIWYVAYRVPHAMLNISLQDRNRLSSRQDNFQLAFSRDDNLSVEFIEAKLIRETIESVRNTSSFVDSVDLILAVDIKTNSSSSQLLVQGHVQYLDSKPIPLLIPIELENRVLGPNL